MNKTNFPVIDMGHDVCPVPYYNYTGTKAVNIALQGGGAHGAFAWGVLDRLLEEGTVHFEGISGTSAGSMNAVVLAYGLLCDGAEGGRQHLHDFWKAISDAGQKMGMGQRMPWEEFLGLDPEYSPTYQFFSNITRFLSPYQFNAMDVNPLRDVLVDRVDFDRLQQCQHTKLFISATNVRSGKVRVFHTGEVTADAVLASACLPQLFKAVTIDGESYWDGGYMGNPTLYPFHYHTKSDDLLIVHINPIVRPNIPTLAHEISNRVTEISFNSSLIHELRAINFVQKLIDEGWIKEEYRDRLRSINIHAIRADTVLADLSTATKFSSDWTFLTMLRDRGRAAAAEWLQACSHNIGKKSTVDLQQHYLRKETNQSVAPEVKKKAS
jgi:NTE family protein